MTELTRHDRALAVVRLAKIEAELAAISTWLSLADADKPAILLEGATRDVMAACWALQQPMRTRPAGWLAQRANGGGYGG